MCATCFTTAGSAVGAAAALGLPGIAAITVGRLTVWRGQDGAGPSPEASGASDLPDEAADVEPADREARVRS